MAAVEFFGLLGDKGKACKRHLRAYHSMAYENVQNSDLDKFGALMGLMDWNLHLSCKAHPMQNSVIWALKFLTTPEISKDAHLALKCFRTCATNTNDRTMEVVQKFAADRGALENESNVREFGLFSILKRAGGWIFS